MKEESVQICEDWLVRFAEPTQSPGWESGVGWWRHRVDEMSGAQLKKNDENRVNDEDFVEAAHRCGFKITTDPDGYSRVFLKPQKARLNAERKRLNLPPLSLRASR